MAAEPLRPLYRRIGALRTVETYAPRLFRFVERECSRLYRGRSKAESLDELLEHDMPASLDVPTDLRLDLVRAMQQLSQPSRELPILRDVHELTASEVAAQMGLSLAATALVVAALPFKCAA